MIFKSHSCSQNAVALPFNAGPKPIEIAPKYVGPSRSSNDPSHISRFLFHSFVEEFFLRPNSREVKLHVLVHEKGHAGRRQNAEDIRSQAMFNVSMSFELSLGGREGLIASPFVKPSKSLHLKDLPDHIPCTFVPFGGVVRL